MSCMAPATILYRFCMNFNVLLLMAVNGKEETLNLSETERTSDLFSVTPDTKSLSKFIPCSRPMEGLMLISACPLITVSLQLLRCIYIYIYIYSKGKCSESVSVRLQEADG